MEFHRAEVRWRAEWVETGSVFVGEVERAEGWNAVSWAEVLAGSKGRPTSAWCVLKLSTASW